MDNKTKSALIDLMMPYAFAAGVNSQSHATFHEIEEYSASASLRIGNLYLDFTFERDEDWFVAVAPEARLPV